MGIVELHDDLLLPFAMLVMTSNNFLLIFLRTNRFVAAEKHVMAVPEVQERSEERYPKDGDDDDALYERDDRG